MQGRGIDPSFHFLSILFCGQPGQKSPQFCKFSFFCFCWLLQRLVFWSRLGYPFVFPNPKGVRLSHSPGHILFVCIIKLRIYNSQWITLPTQSCLVLYSFCAKLGILDPDTINQVERKEKILKEYLRRIRKLLETKHYRRNLIKWMNIWAVPLVIYSRPFIKWTWGNLKQMEQSTRKLMTMHKTLHPRDDVDSLYVSRREGRRGLASIENSVDASRERLEDYIEKRWGSLIRTSRKTLTIREPAER